MQKLQLTDSEKYLWDFLNQNFNKIARLKITEVAELANVSNATIVRTLKKMGYSGFSDFKHSLRIKHLDTLNILDTNGLTEQIKSSVLKNYQEVTRTLNQIDLETIKRAIFQVNKARRIILFARGFSELLGKEMNIKLQLLNKYSELHTDPNIIKQISNRLTTDDFVIFISLNGETAELVDSAKICKENSISTLLISSNQQSSLAKLVDLGLFGFKTNLTYFPDFEVHSRLPLTIIIRILLDTYAAELE